jgi:hypothetical protein
VFGFVSLLSHISWHNKINRKKDFIGRDPFRCAMPANLVAFHGRIKLGGKKIFGIVQVEVDHMYYKDCL